MNQRFAEAATVVEAIDKALGRPTPRNEVFAEVKAIQEFLEWAIGDQLVVHKGKLGNFDFAAAVSTGPTLFVGEGNMSFSLALAKLAPRAAQDFVVTTFEPRMRVSLAAYQNAVKLTRIGAKVLHGVDATRLDRYFNATRFSAIVFNFPNVASRIPVYGHNPNHNLIRRFLRNAAQRLARNGRVIITVVDTPFYSGAFGLTAAAKFAGYKEPDVYAFKPSHFSGYAHANTLGGQSALAKYRNFRSWVFQLP
ncbi:hypothetical protein GCM10011321_42590 [Youhaiella tibetensis]|uniref:DUF2431 domain-containing protein n=1 Tax=Paradevosia tibetensis TaxID=1447062 RepID=A0A5B9DSE2_9HYPH|nr:Rossmann-like fold-containing protein [Youhaiella tibetensis]QEE21855.1 DUF2431 domain-containing protein [Youhaiella tibetensis]GGF47732.1 hypothetical protein GCM10011321_42590 [Youhaiella tibetensis]